MTNSSQLKFSPLDINGDNYIPWSRDVVTRLIAKISVDAIKEDNQLSPQDKAKAMILITDHIHNDLKSEYLTVDEPHILWKYLKERFDHQKLIELPKARYDWIHLRFQDFKTVNEYNSALLKITSKLLLCGETITEEDKLEKTFSTFHASDMLLQQQYRERRFTKYSELISCLLLGEQNNAILLRNHQNHPTGSTPFPEANAATYNNFGRNRGRRDNRGHVRNHERVRGRGHGGKNNQWHRGENKKFYKNKSPYHLKWNNDKGASSSHYQARERKGKFVQNKRNSDDHDGPCFKCGMTNHWSRTCRTPKHLVELYEASMKGKGKGKEVEINFNVAEPLTQTNCVNETTHLDASDFFVNQGQNN